MTISKKTLTTLVAGAFVATMATTALSTTAHAAKEKCYGVVKAGQNACANASGTHACQAQATENGSGSEFIVLPEGVCDKLVGGSVTAFEKAEATIEMKEPATEMKTEDAKEKMAH